MIKLKKCWDRYKKWENFISCLEIMDIEVKESCVDCGLEKMFKEREKE